MLGWVKSPPRTRAQAAAAAAAAAAKASEQVADMAAKEAEQRVVNAAHDVDMTDTAVVKDTCAQLPVMAALDAIKQGQTPGAERMFAMMREMLEKIGGMTQDLSDLKQSNAELRQSCAKLEQSNAELKQSQAKLEHNNAELKQSQAKLEQRCVKLEQALEKQRKEGAGGGGRPVKANSCDQMTFKVTGIPEEGKEGRALADQVKRVVAEKLPPGRSLGEYTITMADRLGRVQPGAAERPRMVRVTVATMWEARAIVANRKFLRKTGVTFFDHLSEEEFAEYKRLKPQLDEALKAKKRAWFVRSRLFIEGKAVGAEGDA